MVPNSIWHHHCLESTSCKDGFTSLQKSLNLESEIKLEKHSTVELSGNKMIHLKFIYFIPDVEIYAQQQMTNFRKNNKIMISSIRYLSNGKFVGKF